MSKKHLPVFPDPSAGSTSGFGRISLPITLTLLSDTVFSSGFSIPGGEDIAVKIGSDGLPFLAGSTLKGLFRESLQNILCWSGRSNETALVDLLLGGKGPHDTESDRRLVFSSCTMQSSADWSVSRVFTQVENGIAKDGSLRVAGCIRSGIVFNGDVLLHEQDEELVRDALRCIHYIGLLRNRGFGHVQFTCGTAEKLATAAFRTGSGHIRYQLRTITPLAIPVYNAAGADTRENFTDTAKFIPGTVIRGMVLSALAASSAFASDKQPLLTEVRFSNALPLIEGRASLPAIKGFYGDKAETEFYSVLLQDVQAGHKRVGLGSCCLPENGVIEFYSPATTSSLRIQRHDKQVFTTTAIAPGEVFEGYIDAPDAALAEKIAAAFGSQISIGADRYAGNGLCEVIKLDSEADPSGRFGYSESDQIPDVLHMLLLSPAAMSAGGQARGLDKEKLAQLLRVESVSVQRCATSTAEISGYNRIYGCPYDTETMYDAGSIFTLKCSSAPSFAALEGLQRTGIGSRTAEGFGKVLFLKDLASLQSRQRIQPAAAGHTEDALIQIKQDYWLLAHVDDLPAGLSSSQLGNIQAICENICASGKGTDELEEHFRHNMEDRGPEYTARYRRAYAVLRPIWTGIDPIPGCGDLKDRLRFISRWIDLSRKEA